MAQTPREHKPFPGGVLEAERPSDTRMGTAALDKQAENVAKANQSRLEKSFVQA